MPSSSGLPRVLASPRGRFFSRLGFLLSSDLRSEKIHKYTVPWWEANMTKGELSVFREQSNGANGLTFDHQGRLLTCETGPGRVTRTEKDGTITVLADRWGGQAAQLAQRSGLQH